jgi:hypothetical protein
MKAEIQSQLETINDQIAFPEIWQLTTEDLEPIRRRKTFLEMVLEADIREVNEKAVNFVYRGQDGKRFNYGVSRS